jgi:hypothetical protein
MNLKFSNHGGTGQANGKFILLGVFETDSQNFI